MNKDWKSYGATVKVDLNICQYCKCEINEYDRTVDHLIPESRGGIRSNDNKVPACGACNQLKGDMTPEEFLKSVQSMIRFEKNQHNKKHGYLKRIEDSTRKIIESKQTKSN